MVGANIMAFRYQSTSTLPNGEQAIVHRIATRLGALDATASGAKNSVNAKRLPGFKIFCGPYVGKLGKK